MSFIKKGSAVAVAALLAFATPALAQSGGGSGGGSAGSSGSGQGGAGGAAGSNSPSSGGSSGPNNPSGAQIGNPNNPGGGAGAGSTSKPSQPNCIPGAVDCPVTK